MFVLPDRTSLSGQVGQALQGGLSSGIQQGANVGFQRGMLQKAMSGLGDIGVETTPGQLMQKLITATAGVPGAERYVAPLYESLSQDLAARQKASPGVSGAVGEREKSISDKIQPQEKRGMPLSKEETKQLLGERFFPQIQPTPEIGSPESLKPQKPLTPPEPIGPAEESVIRKELNNRGITNPAVQDDIIRKTKEFQNDSYKAEKEGFSNLKDYQDARNEKDKDFFAEAGIQLGEAHGEMTPTEQSIWKEMSRQFEDLPNSSRFANTEQMYNTLVGNPLIEFENSQQGLPTGSFFRPEEIKSRMEDARTSVQDHIRRIEDRKDLSPDLKGVIKNQLRDQYFNSMGAKDYGIAQAAYAVSNLSDKTAASVPMAPPPKEHAFDTTYLGDQKERDKYTYQLANSITKMGKDDSLILMREKALQNNYDDKAFNQALNIAIKSGRFIPSDYQATERNKLSIPQRLDLDSIMEGKRSFWDYFKGKK